MSSKTKYLRIPEGKLPRKQKKARKKGMGLAESLICNIKAKKAISRMLNMYFEPSPLRFLEQVIGNNIN
jgi:hypothetical protein